MTKALFKQHIYLNDALVFTDTAIAINSSRDSCGTGFTHHGDDQVSITITSAETLTHGVDWCDQGSHWCYGLVDLLQDFKIQRYT